MSGPVASNSLMFNMAMRYPTAAGVIATTAAVITLNSPITVAEVEPTPPAPTEVPVLLKTIAG